MSGSDGRFWDVWEACFYTFEIDKKATNIILVQGKHKGSILVFEDGKWTTTLKMPVLSKEKQFWMEEFEF